MFKQTIATGRILSKAMQQERICRNNKNYESFKQDFAVSIKIDFLLQSSATFMKLKLE